MLKRLFDISLSSLGFFFFLPLWVLLSFAIWMEDGRPIFYLQGRVGKDNKTFKTVKFRTLGYKKKDSKLSKLLRTTALDELPQLINIFKGEMSFVGPRPLIPEEVQAYKELVLRSSVRPGLTGVAQVLVSKDASVLEKFKHDLWYINNRNFFLDISLILKSFWVSLRKKWDSVKKV